MIPIIRKGLKALARQAPKFKKAILHTSPILQVLAGIVLDHLLAEREKKRSRPPGRRLEDHRDRFGPFDDLE